MRTPHAALDACTMAAVIVQYSGDELLLQLNVIKVSQKGGAGGRKKKVLVVLEHIVKIIAIGLCKEPIANSVHSFDIWRNALFNLNATN